MRWDRNNIRQGAFVMGTQGERIGKVIRLNADTFVVEKGLFFPKDYELRYDHITEVKDDSITYSLSDYLQSEARAKEIPRAAAAPTTAASTGGMAAASATSAAALPIERTRAAAERTFERERTTDRERAERGDEIRIPLMKEEIGVEKVARETGHVRIHKAVRTEEKHFTVPVSREEVIIEHVAATGEMSAQPGDATFQEQTLDLPLHEEELRVTKHPVLREEVVVRTVAHAVEKEGTAVLRREEAEIEDTRKTPAASGRLGDYNAPGVRH
jgi:uncharacterized protein (TIGR02271 family)